MDKMQFSQFVEEVVNKIKEYLPESFASASVELSTVTKNNDLKLTGLTIRSVDSNICPTIYLEQFYDRYQDGQDIAEVLESIADVRVSHEVKDIFDTERILSFDKVKNVIVPKLVNRKWNEQLLQERPHTDIGDLAVTYHISLQQDFDGSASVPVTYQIMEAWDTDVNTLHESALKNMKSEECTFQSMLEVLSSMFGEEQAEMLTERVEDDEVMFVLSNKARLNGAVAVLDTSIMKEITDRLGDFYMLPSSVHEWIVVKATDGMDASALAQMIKDVNQSQVHQDERLSDHPYKYKVGDGLIPV